MRMRKPFAMIAALATLLGGMMIGATSAQATPFTTPITNDNDTVPTGHIVLASSEKKNFQAKQLDGNGNPTDTLVGRTFQYVKLAAYQTTTDPNDATKKNLSLVTNGTKGDNGVYDAVIAGAKAALSVQELTGLTGDPLVWLTKQTNVNWTAFNTAVKTALNDKNYQFPTKQVTVTDNSNFGTDGAQVDFDFEGQEGLYLLIDTATPANPDVRPDGQGTGDACSTKYGPLSDILIGTKIDNVNLANNSNNADKGLLWIDGNTSTLPNAAAVVKTQLEYVGCNGSFQLQKVGVNMDANGLAGAGFTITKVGNEPTYTNDSNGKTLFDQAATGTTTHESAGADGLVTFGNLTAGWYLIKETKTPDSYDGTYAARLVLHVEQDGAKFTYTLTNPFAITGTQFLTTDGKGTNGYKYKNIQNLTQLPVTGAAGVALFVALAALLAGAAGVVYVKSRRTKAMLR
ncbi:hypothetical protein COO72_01310 [Bifidobacterium callitrichos]|nr:hypothetical protein COO72_01310 [Bifidobacterium callitrichos]